MLLDKEFILSGKLKKKEKENRPKKVIDKMVSNSN